MKFIDELSLVVKAGNGGNGHVSFLRSHLNPMSGPDGGNGGRGGDVYFRGTSQLNSFYKISSKKRWCADSGLNGGENLRTGKSGDSLYIDVPLGTAVHLIDRDSKDKKFLGELLKEGQTLLVAKGGRGGMGNTAFASSVNRTPRYAQKGEITEEFSLYLELKVIADIGFLGLPNAGKSTLLNSLTNANVQAADFEFTTLNPQLGVLKGSKLSVGTVIADLPGIIKGASKNKGLGYKFLKHISHCKVLVYVIDASGNDPIADFYLLRDELESAHYDRYLKKEQIILWNKIDLVELRKVNELKSKAAKLGGAISMFISALNGDNLSEFVDLIDNVVEKIKTMSLESNNDLTPYKIYDFIDYSLDLQVKLLKKSYWKISGSYIEKIIEEYDGDDVSKLISKALDHYLVKKKLRESGVKDGDILLIDNQEYFWKFD